MRSMIFREARMTNEPITAVLLRYGRTACWTLFRKHQMIFNMECRAVQSRRRFPLLT
jgi:hypothetical protein